MENQTPTQATIQCSACGQPFKTEVRTLIDVSHDPQGKVLLLSGRLNNATCTACETQNVIAIPLLYHDPTKELLIAYIPMELNLTKDDQEKVIGDLLNKLPKGNDFKGYMFNPRRALTTQGLTEQILEADGITPEMMAHQRERVQLAQQFVEAQEADLPALVEQHDAEIDMEFFQTLSMLAQRMLEDGQPNIAQHILTVQSEVAEQSTFGKELIQQQQEQQRIVEEIAETIQRLGEGAQHADFLELAIRHQENDTALQALVELARPVFDYEFFQHMTAKIGQAPAAERDSLNALRQRILEITAAIDQRSQMAVQNAAGFLKALLNDEQPEELIRANLPVIDDTFMAVLSANIEHAEQNKDVATSARLKEIYNLVITILQEHMQPEMRFVNELLSVSSDEEARALVAQHAHEFDDNLLEVMDAIEQMLTSQGNQMLAERIKVLRSDTQQALNS
jgi:hypothetical protein